MAAWNGEFCVGGAANALTPEKARAATDKTAVAAARRWVKIFMGGIVLSVCELGKQKMATVWINFLLTLIGNVVR